MIIGEPTSFNEMIAAERRHRQYAAKKKREELEAIQWQLQAQDLTPITGKAHFTIQTYAKNARKDPDGLESYFLKLFLDSLVRLGVLENDGQKQVGRRYFEEVKIDKHNPRIEIVVYND